LQDSKRDRKTRVVLAGLPSSQAEPLWEYIKGRGGNITPRDLMRHNNREYPTAAYAKAVLDWLVRIGRGKWRRAPPGKKGGRPSLTFVVSEV
jgi:hypothetical protein